MEALHDPIAWTPAPKADLATNAAECSPCQYQRQKMGLSDMVPSLAETSQPLGGKFCTSELFYYRKKIIQQFVWNRRDTSSRYKFAFPNRRILASTTI